MDKKKFSKKYSSNLACAYPYLYEEIPIVDHEIMMDEIASIIGIVYGMIDDVELKQDLEWLCELSWHIGGSIRGKDCIDDETLNHVLFLYRKYFDKNKDLNRKRFTLPASTLEASYCELIRNKFKHSVRNLFLVEKKLNEIGISKKISDNIYDCLNICSNLFYNISLHLTIISGKEPKTFESKSFVLK